MDVNNQSYEPIKKAYKKAKSKILGLWKTLTIICLVLTVFLMSAGMVATNFDNNLAAQSGERLWKFTNEDADAQYFENDFSSDASLYKYGDEICYSLEAEGAVLLLNNDNALPLSKGDKVSAFYSELLFGTDSTNVNGADFKTALEKSGFIVNPNISAEPLIVADESESIVDKYGDAVIVTISRNGTDSTSNNKNGLTLNDNEKILLSAMTRLKIAGKVKKIIVLLNTSNALQMDFLKDEAYSVDACLWIGGPGATGINAVSDILVGKVNPSGSLVDTYCYDNLSSPAVQNLVINTYDGVNDKNAQNYMIYQEGIYTGYKYYETHYEDYVMGTGNAGDYKYASTVAFPFGFGLSYTQFDYSNLQAEYNAETDQFEISVNITNFGNTAGRETVQLYVQSPYTEYDKTNKVEKAAVVLCGFTKTKEILPGHNEIVTVCVDKRELASYDAYGAKTYILDAGDYYFTAATDAHNAVNNILAAKGYTVENTFGKMDAAGNANLVYKWTNDAFDDTSYSTTPNGTKITNQLSEMDITLDKTAQSEVTYLSRADWQATWPNIEKYKITLTTQMIDRLASTQYKSENYDNLAMPTLGADNNLTLYDVMGKRFNASEWDQLLDQLTFDEMLSIITDSFYCMAAVESVNAPGAMGGTGSVVFTSQDIMAATFNVELITEVGRVLGNDCLSKKTAYLYETGGNIRRTPYGDKNFECYSEDAFLSSVISAAKIGPIQEKGIGVVIKDFVFNDYQQENFGLAIWACEQAVRENYLKAFQKPLEELTTTGIISSLVRLGTTWSGANQNLMSNIVRSEWGCVGVFAANNLKSTYINGVDAVTVGGVTTFETKSPFVKKQLSVYENDAVVVTAMRNACHYNLYFIANSSAMNGVGADTCVKVITPRALVVIEVLTVVMVVFLLVFMVLWILGVKKLRKTDEYADYIKIKSPKHSN